MRNWQPSSWQQKPDSQKVDYPDVNELQTVMATLTNLPPLVSHLEIEQLKTALKSVHAGNSFILQGGDCAESFSACNPTEISNKLRILLQMSLVLIHGMQKPVLRIGRIAGQYAKPRSSAIETINNVSLPSFRGDIINASDFNPAARTPNPWRMLQAYQYASATLNYLRSLVQSGFADLAHTNWWDLDFAKHSPMAHEYQKITENIQAALHFLKAIDAGSDNLKRVDFYTSHEALLLPYEQALTREVQGKYYDLSTHMPWIGMRTAEPDGAHLEFLSGIENPIGIKVGPKADSQWLQAIVKKLNPDNAIGKIILISRLGADQVANLLPRFIESVKQAKLNVIWSVDPMHGNTKTTQAGYKTRHFSDILSELSQTIQIHCDCNSSLNGVHFELTGDNVTECVGGARGLSEADLETAYKTLVDPRLNYEQALEMAMLLVREFQT